MQNTDPKPKKGGVKIGGLKKKLEAKKTQSKVKPTKDALMKPETPIVKAQKRPETGATALSQDKTKSGKNTPRDARKQADNSEPELDLTGLRKPSTYLLFCDWIAQPEGMRNPISQKEFAKLHKVDEDTLTAWKQRKGFWAVVDKRVKAQWREKTGLAMQALFTTILRKGSAKEVQLFLQYVVGFNPRVILEEETPDVQKYDPVALKELATAMENAGLAGVTEEHKKLAEVFNDLALTEEDEADEYDHTDES